MAIDYSQYTLDEYEKYRSIRSNDDRIVFDQLSNHALFCKQNKTFHIEVGQNYEFIFLHFCISEDGTEEQLKKFVWDHEVPDEESKSDLESSIAEQKQYIESLKARYDIDRKKVEYDEKTFYTDHPEISYVPLHNILSGCDIRMQLGEGILDFVYADFDSAYRETAFPYCVINQFLKEYMQENKSQPPSKPIKNDPEKIYNSLDRRIHDYYDFMFSCEDTREITAASLYTAICPPVISQDADTYRALKRYYLYLKALQKEYLDILQFCYDEEYYPEILGDLSPAIRYYTFRTVKDFPSYIERNEEMYMAFAPPRNKKTHEFDLVALEENFNREYPEEALKKLAAELNTTTETIALSLRLSRELTSRYRFSSTEEILELELSKMLENDIRFRKCKRCGRYFIMKGNYDTRYCDRIANGETRSCQELAAQENYKKKMAENKALPIYSKYYKRYAARVKVRQIKENDFKKWKYEALVKRDQCSDGRITTEEYIEWMEGCFPNRKSKEKE